MGLASTKPDNGAARAKRLRTGFEKHINQTRPLKRSGWENLPVEALVAVYQFLPDNDKFNASLTCKAWSRVLSRSEVWRYLTFSFNGRDNERAMHVAEHLAPALRHVTVDCSDTSGNANENSTGLSTANLHQFLQSLERCRDVKLTSLRIMNLERLSWWGEAYVSFDIMAVLANILANQSKLKQLQLSWTRFPTGQGLQILSRVAYNSGSTITDLKMNGFFTNIMTPNIALHLKLFTSLKNLSINYEYLTDAALNALPASKSLVVITVFVAALTNVTPPSSNAWETLKKALPALEARFFINKELGSTVVMKSILSPGIPLAALSYSWIDPCSIWRFFCEYIANHFKIHLRSLDITICSVMLWKNNTEACIASFWEDGFLDKFIESCLLLEEISITSRIDSSDIQAPIRWSAVKALARKPASRLRSLTINGVEVKLGLTWSEWLQAKIS